MSTSQPAGWRSHSRPSRHLRAAKAAKIIAILNRRRPLTGARLLEVGTGSGVIAAHLAAATTPGRVDSVDVADTRIDTGGYEFRLFDGFDLPFGSAEFDVVVSNHVLEHVGSRSEQLHQLREMHRVMAADGLCYLATPSRWSPIEPHFKAPFVTWIPRRFRSAWIHLLRRGDVYDVDPTGPRELDQLAEAAGFVVEDVTGEAVWLLAELESSTRATVIGRLPDGLLARLGFVFPTQIRILRPA